MDQGTSQNASLVIGHPGIATAKAYEAALKTVRDEGATIKIGPHTLSRFYDNRWGSQPGCRVVQLVPRFDIMGSHDVYVSPRLGGFCFTLVSIKRIAASLAREANPFGV